MRVRVILAVHYYVNFLMTKLDGLSAASYHGVSKFSAKLPQLLHPIAVLRAGIMCAREKLPGVYANVPKYVPWIREIMNNNKLFETSRREVNDIPDRTLDEDVSIIQL